MVTVLLCCDEPVVAEGLTVLLSLAGDFELVSHCPMAGDLPGQLELHRPDLLLVDLTADFSFSFLSGLHDLFQRTKIILWVHSISTESALQAASLGVRGILRKTAPVDTLLRCLVRVNEGELWFEKAMTESIMSAKRYFLTHREGQLVTLLTHGLKNKEIATALSITEGTVKVYLSRLFQKLHVKDRFELAICGVRNHATYVGAMGSSVLHPPRLFFVQRTPPQLGGAKDIYYKDHGGNAAATRAKPASVILFAVPRSHRRSPARLC
jgi:two-component system nitrate/nitrite response regulator NarL